MTGAPTSRPSSFLDRLIAPFVRRIGARNRLLAQLMRERDELTLLIESVGEAIIQTGPDGRLVRANRAARKMLDLPSNSRGAPISTLVRYPALRERLEAALRGEIGGPTEIALGDRRVRITTRALGGEDVADGHGTVSILADVTEFRRLEEVRRDFVANASHELKTPLTSIRGYTETLLSDDPPPEIRLQFLQTVHQNAERLQQIIEDLLDLSRLESGRWSPDLVDLDPVLSAKEAWHALAQNGGGRSIEFRIDAPTPTTVLADPVGLRQIFSNLFDNSIRYTPDGGSITVRVAGPEEGAGPRTPGRSTRQAAAVQLSEHHGARNARYRSRGWVTIAVTDTGAGISQESVSRIFERFYRIDPARARAEGGTGLGLAIVKHLVESMGGDISASSKLGKGTTIRFRLPAL
jgi:two-component system phosphate regulon sensor histidine kinase PhoR